MVARARDGVVRLLSVPSSTGEEPYSMAMALLDAGVPADRFRIDAVDVSARVLRLRRAGHLRTQFLSRRGSDVSRSTFRSQGAPAIA